MDLFELRSAEDVAIELLREFAPHVRYSPDQPRDDHGQWTSGSGLEGGPRQEVAVKDYTANSYFSINEKLRQGKDEELSTRQKEIVQHLDKAVAANALHTESTVYRAIDGKRAGDKYLKEGTVEDKAFLSTSKSERGALNAIQDTGAGRGSVTIVEITAPAGTNAYEVGHAYNPMGVGLRAAEGELIFGRNTRIEITKVDKDGRRAWGRIVT